MRKPSAVSTHVQKRGDVYQFCRRIPLDILTEYQQFRETMPNSIPGDIRKYFSGRKFVRFSLKTKSVGAAKRLGLKEANHFNLMLRKLNDWLKTAKSAGRSIRFSDVEQLSWKWFDREIQVYEIARCDVEQVHRIKDESRAYGHLFETYKKHLKLEGRGTTDSNVCNICDDLLRENGYFLMKDSPLYQKLHDEVILRHQDIDQFLKARNKGESIAVPRPKQTGGTQLVGVSGIGMLGAGAGLKTSCNLSIGDVIDGYLEGLPPNKFKRKPQRVLGLFAEYVGRDTLVRDVGQVDVTNFLRVLSFLPVKFEAKKGHREVLSQALTNFRNAEKEHECINYLTWKNNYRAPLGTFFNKVSKNYDISAFVNIATEYIDYPRVRVRESEKQRALSVHELKTLFEGSEFFEVSASVADAPLYWLAVIALYTGARPREICQINPQVDFGCCRNAWYIDIDPTTPAGVGVKKTVKTGDARRIPLHPELVRLGLPKYLEKIKKSGADRMFPEVRLKGGNPFSELGGRFTKYLKHVGLYSNVASPGNKVLGIYILRKTFITLARDQRVMSMGITGHAADTWVTKIQAEHYVSSAEPFEILVQEICKLSIPIRIPLRNDIL